MTALTATLARPAGALQALFRYLAEIGAGIREGYEIANRYDELSRLSDAALSARGLSREDIPQAAVFGRAGRR